MQAIEAFEGVQLNEVALPDLKSPRGFDEWRRSLLASGYSREALVSRLLEADSPIANVRAAQLVIAQPERCNALNARGLIGGDYETRLLAKVNALAVDVIAAYRNTENPKDAIEGPALVLGSLIAETQANETTPLYQEARARAHAVFADALTLREDFEGVIKHATEAEMLSQALGLTTISLSARYQRANASLYQGNPAQAKVLFNEVLTHPDASLLQVERSINAIAVSLLFLGDEDQLDSLLEEIAASQSATFKAITLRDDVDETLLSEQVNGLREYGRIWYFIARSQKSFGGSKQDLARGMAILHCLSSTSQGFMKPVQHVLAAYIHLLQSDPAAALSRVPKLSDLSSVPPSTKAFSLAVRIEALTYHLPSASAELVTYLELAVDYFAELPSKTVSQIAKRLQLLTPLAIALISRHPHCIDAVRSLGDECIMDLKGKTVSVFGNLGLRPVQAVEFILRSFGYKISISVDGSGQRAALSQCLERKYFRRKVWFSPICALHLNWILLCCAWETKNEFSRYWLILGVRMTTQNFGLVPKVQKMNQDNALNEILRIVQSFEQGQIQPIAAAKLLFGERRNR